jgi:ATP/maltotriose-dependent transcriptional regulator MalT/DNA-binding XRE family transcriptional regulator
MSTEPGIHLVGKFDSFGQLLKHLRRQAQLTQRELGVAVGYSEAQISRLEHNHRPPDLAAITALFVPALMIEDQPEIIARLLSLATQARGEPIQGRELTIERLRQREIIEEIGVLESIPAAPVYEVSRPREFEQLHQRIARERCVALCGLPGTGKTTLAADFARNIARVRPVFWMTCMTDVNVTAQAILRQICLFLYAHGHQTVSPILSRAADPGPTLSIGQQISLVSKVLSAEEILLCFDDVHFLEKESLNMLERLLASSTNPYLMVSRSNISIPGITQITLGGLEKNQGRILIRKLGAQLEGPVVKRLLEKAGGNPMLIRLAIGQMIAHEADPMDFIQHLETQSGVAAFLLDTILHDLQIASWQLLGFLAVFRHPLDLFDPTLIELFQREDPQLEPKVAYKELDSRYLVDDPSRARLHPLIRDHIYAGLASDPDRLRRVHHFAAGWYKMSGGDVLETVHHYCLAEQPSNVADMLTDQIETIYNRGDSEAVAQVVDEALRQTRRHSNDLNLVCRLLPIRGDLLVNTARAGEAETSYREAFALAIQLALDPTLQARLALKLAQCLLQRGKAGEALELCQKAGEALQQDDRPMLAQLAAVQGRAQLILSDFEDAAHLSEQALVLADQFAWPMPILGERVRAQAHSTLGIVAHIRRDHEKALKHLQQAVEIARTAGMRFIEYRSLSNLAGIFFETGDLEVALHSYQEAADGLRMLGDQFALARVLHNMASILYARGELLPALEYNEQSLEIKRQLGDLQGMISSEGQLVLVLLTLGRLQEALRIAEHGLSQVEALGDTHGHAAYLDNLALVLILSGDPESALLRLDQAGNLPGAGQDGKIAGYLQNHRALALIAQGDLNSAQEILNAEIPAGSGTEVKFERDLISAILSLARDETATAAKLALALEDRAHRSGYHLYAAMAQRIKRANRDVASLRDLPCRIMTVNVTNE